MATFLKDSFTDTVSTNLSSHTMDVGSGWSYIQGSSATINASNQATDTENPAVVVADAGAGNSDVTASLDLIFGTGAVSGDQNWLTFHAVDSNNYWMAGIQFSGTFDIFENVAGVFTNRATISFSPSVNTTYTCQVVLSGTSVTATINGGNTISFGSMGSGTTKTKYGWRPKSNSGAQIIADNFLVSSTGVAVPIPAVIARESNPWEAWEYEPG